MVSRIWTSKSRRSNKSKSALENERVKNVVTEVELNQNIEIGKAKCEILGTKNPEITTNAINNSSMVIKCI